jgi:hypothetical protein
MFLFMDFRSFGLMSFYVLFSYKKLLCNESSMFMLGISANLLWIHHVENCISELVLRKVL